MNYSLLFLSIVASVMANEPMQVKQNLCCDNQGSIPAGGNSCGGCGGFPCICKGLFGGRLGGSGAGSLGCGSSEGYAPGYGSAPVVPYPVGPVGPGPFEHPTLTPSTILSTVTQTHTETGQVTHIDVATNVETFTTTVTQTHLSTHTEVLHPEKTFTLTRTESYIVWPAFTHTPAAYPCAPSAPGSGNSAGNGIGNGIGNGSASGAGAGSGVCSHGKPAGSCCSC